MPLLQNSRSKNKNEGESISQYTTVIENAVKLYTEEVKNPTKEYKKSMLPFYHLCAAPRKGIWHDLLESLNYWMKLPSEKMQFIQEVTELLYNQLILYDDFIDDSDYRYGQPTAHRIFGPPKTLVASLLSLMLIMKKINALNQPKAIEIVCNHVSVLCDAVGVENDRAGDSSCPTIDEALLNGIRKHGSFLLMLSDLMQCCSDCKTDFTRLNTLISLNMQTMNDHVNLSRNMELFPKDKLFAEDISRGYYSIPVVLAAQSDSLDKDKMINIVRKKTKEVDLNNLCVDLIEQLGGFEESNILEKEVYKLILEEIDELGGNPKLIVTINKLHKCKGDMMIPESSMYNNI